MDVPRDVTMTNKRPTWLCDTLQDTARHATPNGTFRDIKIPHMFSSYMELMSNIIDSESFGSYEEVGR